MARAPAPLPSQKQGPGVASGFSWLLSDLGQDISWHQAPLLAAADADEAVSILASAHTHTDLSRRHRAEAWHHLQPWSPVLMMFPGDPPRGRWDQCQMWMKPELS